ncbi:hypothetical protein M3599_04525 [Niallia circulans]|uniref:hypothetical protein n=1 Tax=Niallia circulans TaxID=1397 RepID=UPI00203F879A|nr:hypothetical protein [Niallia circulans]MCM2980192.1 hypothetical protein [Niallia circulans]
MEKLLIISFILKKVVTDLQDLVSNEEKYIVKLDDQKNFINYIKSQMKVEDGILTLDGGIIITYNYRIISEVSNWDDLPTLWAYLLNSIEELVEEEKSEFYFPSQPINVTLDIYKNDKSKLDFKIENKGFIVGYKTFIYRKENPGLCLGFQKAYSVVLKKLPRGAKIFFGSPTENK